MKIRIEQKYITNNRSGVKLYPKGIVLHETATLGASAEDEYNYFNSAYRGASAHAFVDAGGVIETVPYTEQAWHAGPTANSNFIGIELCHVNTAGEFKKIWDNAVELFAALFESYGWEVNENTLMSHCQVSGKWYETDHTDPVGYFKKFGKTVEDFRKCVKERLEGGLDMSQYTELSGRIEKLENPVIYNFVDENMPQWAREPVKRLVSKGILRGGDGGLKLDSNMLRMAVMLDRALESGN